MASLKDIKRKIKSVQNTQKTTNAMKLVSVAKLKKAEEAAKKSKLYAQKIRDILSEISYKIHKYGSAISNPKFYDVDAPVNKVDIIFITADKGLCGGFNMATIHATQKLIEEYKAKKVKVRLRAIGKKGIEFFNFQGIDILESYRGVSSTPTYEKAQSIIDEAIKDFNSGATDKIIMVDNGYKNMISQEIRIKDIVPIQMPLDMGSAEKFDSLMEVEPSNEDDTIIGELLKKYLEYGMYYSLIDSLAAEHCSRMQAMDNASKNAKAKVKELDLAYNKARQGNITTELIEIISGVESMK